MTESMCRFDYNSFMCYFCQKYMMMKRFLLIAGLIWSSSVINAQTYYTDAVNPEIYRPAEVLHSSRKEIILPQVNGYNIYKADLHTHTIFSDGQVNPAFRLDEAWDDGLDIVAVTEHLEHRPYEKVFVEYTQKYNNGKYEKAVNNSIGWKAPDKNGIMVDLNYPVNQAQKVADKLNLLLVPGIEITRDGTKVGHFNALFTKDNNTVYDPDPVQSVRNAKAQGALVMHNHPGWRRTNLVPTPTEVAIYAEKLVDGVEVMNTDEFYPGVIDIARENGLFVSANSDIHGSTARDYRLLGYDRPMTLVFAKERTLEAVREALESKRTLAYGFSTVSGDEQLLKDFFKAGIKASVIRISSKSVHLAVTNMTSITYLVSQEGQNPKRMSPFHTVWFSIPLDAKTLDLTVHNMFYSKEGHPVVSLEYQDK